MNDEFPFCSIITGDFNAHCSRWWQNDITNLQGEEIDTLTSSAGYSQLIDKPTHNKPTIIQNHALTLYFVPTKI